MSRPGGVNLPKDFDPKDKAYKKFANKLPTRENCDLSDPKEMFLWMLVALPGMNGGHQAMPSSYNMLVSQRIHELGGMIQCPECGYAKEPELKYVPPAGEDPHWLTSPGRWMKPKDAPKEPVNGLDAALDKLTSQQQAALLERLLKKREEGRLL